MPVMVPAEVADTVQLSVRHLSKSYSLDDGGLARIVSLVGGRRRAARAVHALSDVSFDIHAGEAVALLGRNGSGKSTLLSIVTGTSFPTAGSVVRRGSVASLLELGVGFHPERTGRENALVSSAMNGLTRAQGEARLAEIAEFADIGDFFDMPVKTYSTGMFVRLAFAAQTIVQPDIWVIDEALSVGDFAFRHRALRWLRGFLDRGGALLLATHDTGMVDAFCSRALVLDQGQLVHDGPLPGASQLYITRYSQLGVRGTDADWPSVPIDRTASLGVQAFVNQALPRPPDSDYLAKRIELLAVAIKAVDGRSTLEFRSGDTMRVESAFRVHERRPHVSVGLSLHDLSGVMVWGAGVVNSRLLLRVEPGAAYLNTAEVVLDLQPGRYQLNVGVSTVNLETNARTGEFHDRFASVATIRVLSANPPGQGIARLPHAHPPLREIAADHPSRLHSVTLD